MIPMASQITCVSIVCSNVYSGDQRKHQSSVSLAFVRGIQRSSVDSPHKGPVTLKMFPFDDVIMIMRSPLLLDTGRTVSRQWQHRSTWQRRCSEKKKFPSPYLSALSLFRNTPPRRWWLQLESRSKVDYSDVTINDIAPQITLPIDCLFKRFRLRSKETLKPVLLSICEEIWPVTNGFPSQTNSDVESASMTWRHHRLWSDRRHERMTRYKTVIVNNPGMTARRHAHWTQSKIPLALGITLWRRQMETFSVLLAHCAGNSLVTGEFPSQNPVTLSFDILFALCLNKRPFVQSWLSNTSLDLLSNTTTMTTPYRWLGARLQ